MNIDLYRNLAVIYFFLASPHAFSRNNNKNNI